MRNGKSPSRASIIAISIAAATSLHLPNAARSNDIFDIFGSDPEPTEPPPVELSESAARVLSADSCIVDFNDTRLRCVVQSKVSYDAVFLFNASVLDGEGIRIGEEFRKPVRLDANGKARETIATSGGMANASRVVLDVEYVRGQ